MSEESSLPEVPESLVPAVAEGSGSEQQASPEETPSTKTPEKVTQEEEMHAAAEEAAAVLAQEQVQRTKRLASEARAREINREMEAAAEEDKRAKLVAERDELQKFADKLEKEKTEKEKSLGLNADWFGKVVSKILAKEHPSELQELAVKNLTARLMKTQERIREIDSELGSKKA